MGEAVVLSGSYKGECSAFGVLFDVVHSEKFRKPVGASRFQHENQVYIYGWSALGATFHKEGCSVVLMVDAFSAIRSERVAATVELELHPPKDWDSGMVVQQMQIFSENLRKGELEVLVGGYRIFFGKENELKIIDYSVKGYMVSKMLMDEEKFEVIEDRILYDELALHRYLKTSWDRELVGGYNVYRFLLPTGKYIGVTAGCAWIGKSGKTHKNMNVIYDLTKMTMSEARKKVEQSYQHKHIQTMLLWFIHFADMRKKMPTKSDGYNGLTPVG